MNAVRPIAVIFDLDGTLVDSLPGIEFSIKSAFARCGIPYPVVDLRRLIGPPIRIILSRVANTTDSAVLADLESAFRTSYDSDGCQKCLCFPGTENTLRALREAGLRLFVVTNKPRHISLRILEMTGLASLFESIITRDARLPHFTDKREMVEFLLESYGLAARVCLLVGDTEEDAGAAAQCNMRFAHVSHGYGNISEEFAPHVELNDFSQLPQRIGLEFAHDR